MTLAVVYSNFGGMVVSETRGGVESDYICDTLGSTIGLMNSAGTMTDRWEYWPFGEVVSRTGTSVTPLTFLGVIGYYQDILAKMFYVRARHIRVDLARWLTTDRLWPQEPPYRYARNSPARYVDNFGLGPIIVPAGPVACTPVWGNYINGLCDRCDGLDFDNSVCVASCQDLVNLYNAICNPPYQHCMNMVKIGKEIGAGNQAGNTTWMSECSLCCSELENNGLIPVNDPGDDPCTGNCLGGEGPGNIVEWGDGMYELVALGLQQDYN